MVTYFEGDLLESGADFICHQVNCQGAMNSGVAKAIRTKWPKVYHNYSTISGWLGNVQFVELDKQWVVNMFAQYNGEQYTNYEAFQQCLNKIANVVPKDKRIAFPYKIGCVRGGANWEIIKEMIEHTLSEHQVEFWRLNNDKC